MAKKGKKAPAQTQAPAPSHEPVELTPKQLKEKRREEARARAAETRRIVTAGTSAWTGKLPAQILNEHCAKLHWERVEYPSKGSEGSFKAAVILSKRNPKTKEIEKVRIDPHMEPQKTPVEARHIAATYALHRIASHKNMKLMLPPGHRDLWVSLDEEKASAPKRNQWMWSEDPFSAREVHLKEQKEFEENKKIRREREKEEVLRRTFQSSGRKVKFNTTLSLSRSSREYVEDVLRTARGFRFSSKNGISDAAPEYNMVFETIIGLGFEKVQATEALKYTSTPNDALVWLLVHVPEDDLPSQFMPAGGGGISARVTKSLDTERKVTRVHSFGYSESLARAALAESGGSITQAVVSLTHRLAQTVPGETSESSEEIWMEECRSIQSIYAGFSFDHESASLFLDNCNLKVTFFRSPDYPNTVPGLGLESQGVPKYVILDATRQAAKDAAENMLGDFMLSVIIMFLEEHFTEIVTSPCELTKISSGVSGIEEHTEKSEPLGKTEIVKRRSLKPDPQAKDKYDNRMVSLEGQNMLKQRESLPAWRQKSKIANLVENNQVTLITGETGSGKSTQVVQFIADSCPSSLIVCTQPRRISAIGVASRVAEERLTPLGADVGYVIRGETKAALTTQIRFVTAGILLRMIQQESVRGITHIVVDEIHERSLDGDFLLILLKRLIKHANVKVILMSATVNPEQFLNYFGGNVGFAHIEGRTYPVKKVYLDEIVALTGYVPPKLIENSAEHENIDPLRDLGRIILALKDAIDYQLVAKMVEHIHNSLGSETGSILIFMSGVAEIDRTLKAIGELGMARQLWALPLHAALSPNEQRKVFKNSPKGTRKVVVATNIAETSITISDVVAVVDSGRVKQTVFDPETNGTRLVDTLTSRAAATQRQGRAGRVRPGVCYKMYTKSYEQDKMAERPPPEMLRSSLEVLYLQVKAMGVSDVSKFLDGALDPPDASAIIAARSTLVNIGALDAARDSLTPLGKHMALIPADPRLAKLLVLGTVFGVLPRALTVAAILSTRSPFISPRNQLEEAKIVQKQEFGIDEQGDIVAAVRAYEGAGSSRWCNDHFVSWTAIREIGNARRQLLASLVQTGFVETDVEHNLPASVTRLNQDWKVLRSILASSLPLCEIVYPTNSFKNTSVGSIEVDPEARSIRYFLPQGTRVFIHPGSQLFGAKKFVDDAHYLAFASQVLSTKHFIGGGCPCPLWSVVLFGTKLTVDPLGGGIIIDDWTGLRCLPRVGVLVQFLQRLFGEVLSKKFEDPSFDISADEVVQCFYRLLSTE